MHVDLSFPRFRGPVFFLFLALAAALCLPALRTPSARIVGNIQHPGLQGELFHQSDIVANARAGDLFHAFESQQVAAPEGADLREFTGFSLHLFFYLPLIWVRDLIVRYNLLLVITLALNGYCAYRLGRFLTQQPLPALVCGLFFMLSPYALLKLDMGFLQKTILWWIPLFLHDLLRFQASRRRRDALLAGLAWSAMLLTYAPYAWYAVGAGALWMGQDLLTHRGERRTLFTQGWPALLPALAAVLFLTLTLPHAGGTPPPEGAPPLPLAVEQAPTGSLDITHPFRFHPYHDFMPGTDALPLGLSLLGVLLALAAVRRRARHAVFFLALALVFLLIASGPYPHAGGNVVSRVPLPYYFLARYLPWGARLGFSIRALPFVEIALAALAALALARPASVRTPRSAPMRAWRCLLPFAVLVLIPTERALFLPELFPPRTTSTTCSADLQWLRQQGGTVLHLPVNIKGDNVRRYLYITARTATRMMNPYLNVLEGFPVPPLPHPTQAHMQSYVTRLRRAGCDLIVVHPEQLNSRIHPMLRPSPARPIEPYTLRDTAAFRSWCGPPVYSNATGWIAYRVPDRPRPPQPQPTAAADGGAPSPAAAAATATAIGGISEAELRAYYAAHRDVFQRARQIRVHRFFVPLARDATAVDTLMAEEEARRIRETVARDNAASFALAERLTREDPLGRRWGDIGYIARGCLPDDVDTHLFELETIGATVMLQRADGFHVFRLMDIRPGHTYAFDEVRTAIRDAILRERQASGVVGMVRLPGGEFWMGSTEEEIEAAYRMAQRFAGRVTTVRREWFEDEVYRRVRVRPFYMDRHEVTMGAYRAFVAATGHRALPTWAADIAPRDNMPVVGVSLADARAYAAWVDKRLPTVEEWVWAATGPQRRRFPWGDAAPDGTRCNYADASTDFGWNDPAHHDGFARLAPVGSFPAGATPEGILDLAGNVREWTATAMLGILDRRDAHIWSSAQRHCVPVAHQTAPEPMYGVRGGGWNNAADDMRCADERMLPPTTRDPALGFRCVRDAAPQRGRGGCR